MTDPVTQAYRDAADSLLVISGGQMQVRHIRPANKLTTHRQSRIDSIIEVVLNIAIGATISLLAQIVIFPAYGIHVSADTHFWIVGWFTVVSIARQYVIRRICNGCSPWIYLRSLWS